MGGTEIDIPNDIVTAGAHEIIERATQHNIAVIHIEPGPRLMLVRYRHGGDLYVANKLPLASAEQLARHFKSQAELDLEQVAVPQSGRFELRQGRRNYLVEIDTVPVLHGEKITIRLNELTKSPPSLEKLGFWGDSLDNIKRALTQTRGLISVGGRSVGGLNLTLSALIQKLDNPALKTAFVNAEDLPLPLNIRQVTVKPGVGLSAARQLAILARDNFDVFGVSVIDDSQTGEKIAELARHHLVLTGVLAGNAASSLASLDNLKVEPATMTPPPYSIGQAFVKRLCEHCRESYRPAVTELRQLDKIFGTGKAGPSKHLYELEQSARAVGLGSELGLGSDGKTITNLWRSKPHGCSHCDHTGYAGEIGLFEVLKLGSNSQKALLSKDSLAKIEQAAIKDGLISLQVDGLVKALRGQIDLPTLFAVVTSNFR